MKFKKAPRTKWRFVSGPVTSDMCVYMNANDESAFDEEEFEEEVGGYISQLEAEGVTDQKEILWRFMQTGLMAENALTAKDILRKIYQRIADLEEYLSEYRGDRRQVKQILEEELDAAFDACNGYWCLAYEDALDQLRNGGIADALFSLLQDVKRYVRMNGDEDKKD